MGKWSFIYKSEGGIGSDRSDQKISDLLEEGRILAGKVKRAGVKTTSACLGELTITWKRSLTTAACLKRLWTCKVKNTVARKGGNWACSTIIVIL